MLLPSLWSLVAMYRAGTVHILFSSLSASILGIAKQVVMFLPSSMGDVVIGW